MKSKPNIILIVTDQQRGDALGIAGHPHLMTPNIDNLAVKGDSFYKGVFTLPVMHCGKTFNTDWAKPSQSRHGRIPGESIF